METEGPTKYPEYDESGRLLNSRPPSSLREGSVYSMGLMITTSQCGSPQTRNSDISSKEDWTRRPYSAQYGGVMAVPSGHLQSDLSSIPEDTEVIQITLSDRSYALLNQSQLKTNVLLDKETWELIRHLEWSELQSYLSLRPNQLNQGLHLHRSYDHLRGQFTLAQLPAANAIFKYMTDHPFTPIPNEYITPELAEVNRGHGRCLIDECATRTWPKRADYVENHIRSKHFESPVLPLYNS